MEELICPHCGKSIYDDDALFCLFCGESLNRSAGFLGKVKNFPVKAIALLIAIIAALSFLFLMVF